jgi:CHAT domain-containing protein
MATCGRGLCLILTLWMAGSRSATAVRTGLPDSSPLWDQDPRKIQKNALRYREAGDFVAAEILYWEGYHEAVRLSDKLAAVRYLISAGGCKLLAYQYRGALATYLQARDLATAIGDRADLGAIAVNLSSVYLQVWDLGAALRAAEDGLAQARAAGGHAYFNAPLLLELGRLHTVLGDGQAVKFFATGIEAARAQGNPSLEAEGWDLLGDEQFADQRLDGAEHASLEAFRLRALFIPRELGISYGWLGALKLAQGDLEAASRFTQRSAGAARRGVPSWPEHLLQEQQGRIRLARGEVGAALADFSSALDATAHLRLEILPARASLPSANIGLEQQVFRSYIQLAANHASRTANRVWVAKAFQALEVNRAASLRESVALADVWKVKLAPEYWDVLGQLAWEETRPSPTASTVAAENLRLKLTEMEAKAGVGFRAKKDENFRNQTSLTLFQGGLRDSELFLSFALGETESYLWAVGRESLQLYRLRSEQEIAADVRAFREALPTGGPEAARRGQKLYQELFGQLRPQESQKTAWLLSLEGALFDLPFAALVTERRGGNTVYLVERHSLQTVPGALLLGASEGWPDHGGRARGQVPGEFLGVGDPIYNVADLRWRRPVFFGLHPTAEGQLDRLVGSGREVEASAQSWRDGSGSATVLQGASARLDTFLGLLGRHPVVIHLATHVLAPADRREQAFLAFGLGTSPAGSWPQPQYLTTSSIAGLDVAGALVVMTGCATGAGDARAGAGLLGLTRAWLMAGAGAVISTAWPVEDSAGDIFSRFYHYLPENSAAEALRRSQVEMARGGTWRAAPAYWASYQLTGGSRQ